MSILPEYIIQQTLVQGLRHFREDGRLVDILFRNLHQEDLSRVRSYFQDNSIDISLNYPDQDLKVPAIVILLKSENEEDAFLGNVMQAPQMVDRLGMPFHYDERGGAASQTTVTQAGVRTLVSEIQVTEGLSNGFRAAQGEWPLFDPFEEPVFAAIVSGTGVGQSRQVTGVSPASLLGADSTFQVSPNWDTQPDATSVIRIQAEGAKVAGEPSTIFRSTDIVERRGAHYRVTYQLLILAQPQDLTVYLYNIVKAILFINQDFLIEQGFHNLSISGTDFLPRSEYLPDLVYQRALNMDFVYSFDCYVPGDYIASEAARLLTKLRVSITVNDPDVRVLNVERKAQETELDL